jgi:hypothetical protein
MTTTVTGILCWRDSHPLEWQLASLHGHFETKSEAASLRISWSHPPTRADVLGLGKQGGALVHAADDERRQAKRNSLADKLTVEARALTDLRIERTAVESERRIVEADLGPVKYLATLFGAGD